MGTTHTDSNTPQATAYGQAILLELNRSKHIYEGTVDPAEKARRRKANKAARAARKAARR